jgi:hypothetical protein
VQSSGKVYTNSSLPSEPAPAPPAPAADAAAASPGTPAVSGDKDAVQADDDAAAGQVAPAGAPAEPKKDEAYWRMQLAEARDGLARAQTFAEALQSRINALTADFANRDDPAQRSVIAADRQKALTELERVRKEIDEYTKAIAKIQEDARRAGVPAGWVR